ncbi:MAG TPA: PAS domain S-box protein [Candidatus Binatia bacterium]
MTVTEGAGRGLRADLERLRVITQLAGVPIAQFDARRRYVWANEEYGALVGRRVDDLVGRELAEVVGARAYEVIEPFVARVLRGERVEYDVELDLRTGRRAVHSVLAPTLDDDGAVTGWIGIVRDLTERRRFEETQARLAAIVASSDDAIVGKTLDGVVTSWNEGAERLFGFAADEMIGQPIQRIIPPDRIDDMAHILKQIRAGRRVDHYETERVRKDGRRIHVSLTVSPIKDAAGRVIGASKIARDVTERKRNEAEIREALGLLATLHRTSARLSAELDLRNLVQVAVDIATEVTHARFGAFFFAAHDESGASHVQVALSGNAHDAFGALPIPRESSLLGATFPGGETIRLADVRRDPRYGSNAPYEGTPPGHPAIVSYLATPIVLREEVLGGLFLGHPEPDVFSERDERFVKAFAAQAAVAMENARLYELERKSRARAEAANRAKDDFLSMVSHELRTPLQSMLGWVAVMRQGLVSPERMARAIDAIERSGRVQAKLIDDLLDVSRMVHGTFEIERRPVAVRTVCEAAVEAIRPEAIRKGVTLEATIEDDLVVVGDAVRIEQIITNLLRNAVKFTPAGRGVYVSLRRQGDSACVVVRDEGEGIDAEFLPHVFERFRQAEEVRKRTTSGLGLGLAIVKSLVEHHHGEVEAQSPGRGQGATFTVRLPLASQHVAGAGEGAGSSGSARAR